MKSPKEEKAVILVGTYRAAQMKKWILPKGYYNYPVGAEDDCSPDHCRRIKELWLYKGKTGRKVFAAEFLGVKARAELPDSSPTLMCCWRVSHASRFQLSATRKVSNTKHKAHSSSTRIKE